MALAIHGMPLGKISTDVVRRILEGGSAVAARAGIPVAGGHAFMRFFDRWGRQMKVEEVLRQ